MYENMEYALFVKKNTEKKFSKNIFSPRGGLNPRTLDLKFTALTTRPKELTQEVDKNDGTKLYRRFLKISVFSAGCR